MLNRVVGRLVLDLKAEIYSELARFAVSYWIDSRLISELITEQILIAGR
ncbi:MAG: hypothetical protein PUP92_29780 [Rhizonema sp. PD38]|nr:hypothetical protein [Rhizonema sp. PD38]